MTIRIGLVDDHYMVVEGLEAALLRYPDLELISHGSTVDDARDLLLRPDLDVVLLDVRLEDGNGLQTLAEREPSDSPKVLVISAFNVTQYAAAAARFGASGFLLKAVPLQVLVGAIRVIDAGGTVFSAEHLERRFVTLTARERVILRLAMDGLSNKEIGARLGVHRKTVEAHLSKIFAKYEILGGRVDLSIHAVQEGWLEIQPPAGSAGAAGGPGLRSGVTPAAGGFAMRERSRMPTNALPERRERVPPEDIHADAASPRDPDAAKLGRRGGLKGGRARAAKLGPERLSESARHAAAARWRRCEAPPEPGPSGA